MADEIGTLIEENLAFMNSREGGLQTVANSQTNIIYFSTDEQGERIKDEKGLSIIDRKETIVNFWFDPGNGRILFLGAEGYNTSARREDELRSEGFEQGYFHVVGTREGSYIRDLRFCGNPVAQTVMKNTICRYNRQFLQNISGDFQNN